MTHVDDLGPAHVCRRDDPGYASVGDWYEAHRGRVPIQAAMGLSRLVREQDMTFAEAYRTLGDRGAIILLEDERDPEQAPADPEDHAGDSEVDDPP